MILAAIALGVSLAATPEVSPPPPPAAGAAAAVDLRPLPPSTALAMVPGAGDGEPHHHDDGDHMTTMWIVMGAMMAVMMVGAGVYMMNHSTRIAPPTAGAALVPSPAASAIPPARNPGG